MPRIQPIHDCAEVYFTLYGVKACTSVIEALVRAAILAGLQQYTHDLLEFIFTAAKGSFQNVNTIMLTPTYST